MESEEYSQYAFPALRALEGHMKYLITKAGGTVGRWFSGFNKDAVTGDYIYTSSLTDTRQKSQIEKCDNYYKAVRDTVFHFGDIMGSTDSTMSLIHISPMRKLSTRKACGRKSYCPSPSA